MNSTSLFVQNWAVSGGPLVPLIAVAVLTGSADRTGWVRIAANCTAALVSLLICYVTATFVLDKSTGHRWFNVLAFLYFAFRLTVHVWVAFDWWVGKAHLPLFISLLSSSTEIIFGMYFYVTRRDLSVTYRRSEVERQKNIDHLENIEQAAMNLEYLAKDRTGRSKVLSELIENVGRGI